METRQARRFLILRSEDCEPRFQEGSSIRLAVSRNDASEDGFVAFRPDFALGRSSGAGSFMDRVRRVRSRRRHGLRVRDSLQFFGLFVLWLGTGWAQAEVRPAQKFGPVSSGDADNLLTLASNLAQDRQWSEALNIYQRVIDQFGDKVVMLPNDKAGVDGSGDFGLYVDNRRFCHIAIAQLPPEAARFTATGLTGWRRVGFSRARAAAISGFCDAWSIRHSAVRGATTALELLGDLAFQEGRFGEALAMYGRLVADRPGDPILLVHPDPSVDLARIAAKKLICRGLG